MQKIKKLLRFTARALLTLILVSTLGVIMISKQKSDQYFKRHAVMINGALGQCSGEQVEAPSGKTYVLSAGHCAPLADSQGRVTMTTEDGRRYEKKLIKEDRLSDLALFEGIDYLDGLSVAQESHRAQHVRTYTHGKGHATYETEGELMETGKVKIFSNIIDSDASLAACSAPKYKVDVIDVFMFQIPVCFLYVTETAMTAKIVPGSSGGMVIDDSGKLVGVVSAGDGDFGEIVTIDDINAFLSGF